jgi:hypothetical protein
MLLPPDRSKYEPISIALWNNVWKTKETVLCNVFIFFWIKENYKENLQRWIKSYFFIRPRVEERS